MALRERRTDDGRRFIQRLLITGVGDRLVYVDDCDALDHQYGHSREVCFHRGDWDVTTDSIVSLTYEREKDVDGFPPMLVHVDTLDTVSTDSNPDILLDL
jgi:hypothetical protein